MDVFDLAAKLTLDSSEFDKGLENAAGSASSFGSVAKGVGAGIAGVATTVAAVGAAAIGAGKAIYDNVSAVAKAGDEIDKQSQKLSISAEMYQKLSYACDLSGASIENLKRGIVNITDDLAAVAAGGEEAETKFAALGVSAYDLEGNLKSSEAVMYESLLALADMSDETERNAAANEIFGKSYQELLPLLNSGSEGIAAMMTEAEQFGMVMSDETVKAAANFNDALTQLQGTFQGVKNDLLANFLPSITTVMDGFSDLLAGNEGAGEKITSGFMDAIDNVNELLPRIFSIVETVVPAVMEVAPKVVEALISGIVKTIPKLIPAATQMIQKLVTTILSMLPQILQAGMQIFVSLVDGIGSMLPELIPQVVQTLVDLITTFFDNADALIDAALGLINGLIDGIIAALPILIAALPKIIEGIVAFFNKSNLAITQAATALIMGLVDAIPIVITELNKALPDIIYALIRCWQESAPDMLVASVELLSAILAAIPMIVTELWAAMPDVIEAVIQSLEDGWPEIVAGGQEVGMKVLAGFASSETFKELGEKVKEIIGKITENFEKYFNQAKTWGKDLMDNFIQGIKDKIQKLKDTVSSVAQAVKDFLGFSEPEKGPLSNFHTYAPDMIDLFTKGIYDGRSEITSAISDVFDVGDMIGGSVETAGGSSEGAIVSLLSQYLPQLANMRIVMDTGATVGQLAPKMDQTLARRATAKERYI